MHLRVSGRARELLADAMADRVELFRPPTGHAEQAGGFVDDDDILVLVHDGHAGACDEGEPGKKVTFRQLGSCGKGALVCAEKLATVGAVAGTVYFDLETQRSFRDVGGAANKIDMGMSVGVTYSTETGQFHIFGEDDAEALVEQLVGADLVVGFNHVGFDYPVLEKYTILQLGEQTQNCDMLIEVEQVLGYRIKLDSIASASLGVGKSADGLSALKWWQQYKKTKDPQWMMKIAEYCCYDVKVTREVYEFGKKEGILRYEDKGGQLQEMACPWG